MDLSRRLRRLDEHPIMRDIGFGTEVSVKTTWSSRSGLELGAGHLNASPTRFRLVRGTYPANPVPLRMWRDLHPERVGLWDGRKSGLQVRWHLGLRPFFSRLYLQRDRVAGVCSRGCAQGVVDPEPVAALPVWFEGGMKAGTIDGALHHGHAA